MVIKCLFLLCAFIHRLWIKMNIISVIFFFLFSAYALCFPPHRFFFLSFFLISRMTWLSSYVWKEKDLSDKWKWFLWGNFMSRKFCWLSANSLRYVINIFLLISLDLPSPHLLASYGNHLLNNIWWLMISYCCFSLLLVLSSSQSSSLVSHPFTLDSYPFILVKGKK